MASLEQIQGAEMVGELLITLSFYYSHPSLVLGGGRLEGGEAANSAGPQQCEILGNYGF